MICSYKNCNNKFEYRSNKKFCSRSCKQKNSQSKNENRKQRSYSFFKNDKYLSKRKRYTKHKKNYCQTCGFVPLHKCQLDVDHIDGNHKNDALDNLQTLCANCHRLKTYINKDWKTNN